MTGGQKRKYGDQVMYHGGAGRGGSLRGVHDVTAHGARGDGEQDDAGAVQQAIDAAGEGGIVWIPPGIYRLGAGLSVASAAVQVVGAGWDPRGGGGSWVLVTDPSVAAITITRAAAGAAIKNLAVRQAHPAPGPGWTPRPYPAALEIGADDVLVRDVHLFNVRHGVSLRSPGGSVGRARLERIFGEPLEEGITIDTALDVVMVDGVHFWPFWSLDDPNVAAYRHRHAVAIRSLRNDNPHLTRLFAFGYAVGIQFEAGADVNAGPTSRFRISDADLDDVVRGVAIRGADTTGMITNLTVCGVRVGGSGGIDVDGARCTLQATNVRVTHQQASGIRVSGPGSRVLVDNVWLEGWDRSRRACPGIEAAAPGTTVRLGSLHLGSGTEHAPLWGGAGTVHVAG